MLETEAKVLEIDPAAVTARLQALGAVWEFTEEFEAVYFEDSSGTMAARKMALRLRREGPVSVLTFKTPDPDAPPGIKRMFETETQVGDVDAMAAILRLLGYQETLRMKKMRTQYRLPGGHVVLDRYLGEWGHIPEFLEIETTDADRLLEIAAALGYASSALSDLNTFGLIRHYAGRLSGT